MLAGGTREDTIGSGRAPVFRQDSHRLMSAFADVEEHPELYRELPDRRK
jgi:hypothetical protein